jgi:energy-coupling factor transporter ATP-binding protein EcfA2
MKIFCHITASPSSTNSVPQSISSAPTLPIPIEVVELELATAEIMVVTGPNGVGKSALLGEIARSCGDEDIVETFFGGRSVMFDSENVDQIENSLQLTSQFIRQNTTRYRQPNRDQQFKSVMRRIINAQTQSTEDAFRAAERGASLAHAKLAHPRPLDTINGIFANALLPIEIVLRDGVLKAKRGVSEYGIDRMSDGERAALLIAGAVVVRPPSSFIAIDEPERHLNPAISGALLSAVVRARPDVGYIFATHDLQLIQWLRPNQVIHVRDSVVIEPHSEKRRFDIAILAGENDLPEELRYAILGTRQKLLLVEGAATSEDQALYRHLYLGWNVIAQGGWETVSTGVRALSRNSDYHWLTAVGIIDGDGRDESERASLAKDQIHCLPVPTIENLFLHPVVLEKMAHAAHELQGGDTGNQRLAKLNDLITRLLQESRSEIVTRRLVWETNRLLSGQKVSVQSVENGQSSIDAIDLQPLRNRIETAFDAAVNVPNPTDALNQLPVKSTKIPKPVAKVLGFENFDALKRAVLKQIESGSDTGDAIKMALRAELPILPDT